jgi:hypothetical protein
VQRSILLPRASDVTDLVQSIDGSMQEAYKLIASLSTDDNS